MGLFHSQGNRAPPPLVCGLNISGTAIGFSHVTKGAQRWRGGRGGWKLKSILTTTLSIHKHCRPWSTTLREWTAALRGPIVYLFGKMVSGKMHSHTAVAKQCLHTWGEMHAVFWKGGGWNCIRGYVGFAQCQLLREQSKKWSKFFMRKLWKSNTKLVKIIVRLHQIL